MRFPLIFPPRSAVLWFCRRQWQPHSTSPLAGRLSSGFMASLRLPVPWKFSLPFPATSQSAWEQLGFHSWELCSEWKFLVKIIPGYEWSVQEETGASPRSCGNSPTCPGALSRRGLSCSSWRHLPRGAKRVALDRGPGAHPALPLWTALASSSPGCLSEA